MTDNNNVLKEAIKQVIHKIIKEQDVFAPIGISNRHIHLSRQDLDILFGRGYELTKLKELKQPGQFAAKETVKIFTSKGFFENVRILGPVREDTQVEISISDSYILGVSAQIRESGVLKGTSGVSIQGPCGIVEKDLGVIAALRHIHMPLSTANIYGFKDKEIVDVEIEGIRSATLKNVLLRVSPKYALEMHLDTDEANSCAVKNGDMARIIRKGIKE